jgi:ZIP family zinc transporter
LGSTHVTVILLSLISVGTTSLGVTLALMLRENIPAITAGIGFSTGLMILIAAVELVPESIVATGIGPSLATTALGAGFVWLVHLLIPHVHLFEEYGAARKALARSALLVAAGLILHDLPEGFAMANAYIASPALGVLVALAIALHNVPEEFAMAVPGVALRSRTFLYATAALSALAEPLGAVIGLAAVGVAPGLNAHFLAFSAGAMLYVAFHELIPMARQYGHTEMFALGSVISAVVYVLLASMTVGRMA